MELTITAAHTTVTPAIRDYAQKRLSKLDRRLRKPVPVHLTLRREQARKESDRYVAEVTIKLKKAVIRSEEHAESPYAAIDLVEETTGRQISRYKARFDRKRREAGTQAEAPSDEVAELLSDEVHDNGVKELADGQLVRTKHHPVHPITVEEAAAQMDLLGHNFYVFRNRDTQAINVVYRRHDDDYGLIIPTEAA